MNTITRRSALKLAGVLGLGFMGTQLSMPCSAQGYELEKTWPWPALSANTDDVESVQIQATFEQSEARKLLELHNIHRTARGLCKMEWSSELEEVAKVRAVECAITGVLPQPLWTNDHDGPTSFSVANPSLYHGYGSSLAAARVLPESALYGVDSSWTAPVYDQCIGENAGTGQRNAQAVFNGWLASSGHKATVECDIYRSFAAACAKVGGQRFWIALFWNKGNASGMNTAADDGTHLLAIPAFAANLEAWRACGGLKSWGVVGEGQYGGTYTWPRPSEPADEQEEVEQPVKEDVPELEYAPMPDLAVLCYAYQSHNGVIKIKKKPGVKKVDADSFEAVAYRGTGKTNKERCGVLPLELDVPTDGVWTVWVRCTRGDETTEWTSLGRVNAVYIPSSVPHTRLDGGKGCFTLGWKTSRLATGYQIAFKKKGACKWTSVVVGKRTSKKVSKLAKGSYDVRFRPLRMKDGVCVCCERWNEVGRVVVR